MGNINKTQLIKRHLITKGTITTWDAIKLYGETRLSDVIYRLKKRGMDITTYMVDAVDKYGNPCRYANYVYKGVEEK